MPSSWPSTGPADSTDPIKIEDFLHLPANGVPALAFQLSAPKVFHVESLGDLPGRDLKGKLSLAGLVD